MPVRIGRVSSRDAERATRLIVSTNAAAGTLTTVSPPGSGSGGKSSARSVRMWNVAEPDRISTSCSAGRSSSVAVLAGQRARDVEHQARRQHDGALALDASPRAARAGRPPCRWRAARRRRRRRDELDAGQGLNGAARRGDAGDHAELCEQVGGGRRELHDEHLGCRYESHRACADVQKAAKRAEDAGATRARRLRRSGQSVSSPRGRLSRALGEAALEIAHDGSAPRGRLAMRSPACGRRT